MMKQMRENTKWIMLVTALAFVGLMVFEWGMDASGRSGLGVGRIGSVNGTPVMYDEYMATYRNLYDQVREQRDEPISTQENEDLEDAAWDEIVNQILIRQELERRGLNVAPEEIRQAARFTPPAAIRENPAFQTDGRFDLQKYQDFLATSADPTLLFQLEQYYRDVIPRSKLLRQVTAGIYVSDRLLWWEYRRQNERIRARLAAAEADARVPDSEVSVSDEEIESYYEENRENFLVPAQAQLRVVQIDKAPTPEDTAAARDLAVELREEILAGAEFAEVARRESADEGTRDRGGDLGTFTRGGMVPAFEEAAFSAEEGTITEPVQTRFGYPIIPVREQWEDSVAASHVLVPIERTDESELRMLTEADSLESMLESRSFEEAARGLGLEARSYTLSASFPFVPGLGQVPEGAEWALQEGAPGQVSPLFENDQAFYAFELLDRQEERYRTLEEVRDAIVRNIRVEKKKERVLAEMEELLPEVRDAGSLEEVASAHGLTLDELGPLSRLQASSGLNLPPEVVGTAFGLEEGEIGGPVAGPDRVFLLEVVERIPADSAAWEEQKDVQRQQMVNRLQQERLEEWLAGLREDASIQDQRDEVLRDPGEEPPAGFGLPAY